MTETNYNHQNWYMVGPSGVQEGPMDLRDLASRGLTANTMVWHPGMADWKAAGEVSELSGMLGGEQSNVYKTSGQPQGQYNAQGGSYPGSGRIPDPNNPGNWTNPNPGNSYGTYGGGYSDEKSNIVAGLLSILLGYLGVQYFYCGKITGGFLCILLSLASCGLWSIVTLIQGIYMLTLSPDQFQRKYVYTPATFPIF